MGGRGLDTAPQEGLTAEHGRGPNTTPQGDSTKGEQVLEALPPQGDASARWRGHDTVPRGDPIESGRAHGTVWRPHPTDSERMPKPLPLLPENATKGECACNAARRLDPNARAPGVLPPGALTSRERCHQRAQRRVSARATQRGDSTRPWASTSSSPRHWRRWPRPSANASAPCRCEGRRWMARRPPCQREGTWPHTGLNGHREGARQSAPGRCKRRHHRRTPTSASACSRHRRCTSNLLGMKADAPRRTRACRPPWRQGAVASPEGSPLGRQDT